MRTAEMSTSMEDRIAQLYPDQAEFSERMELVTQLYEDLTSGEHELVTAAREIEAELNEAFPRPGLRLTTTFGQQLGAADESGEFNPDILAIHVDDMGFSSEVPVYQVQLAGAALRAIASALIGHDFNSQPTLAAMAVLVELTRTFKFKSGRYLIAKDILDTERFGLSPFRDYLEAAGKECPVEMFSYDMDLFARARLAGVGQLFLADGGPLALIDDDDLRQSLTDEEVNEIGHLQCASVAAAEPKVRAILVSAAHRRLGLLA